MAIRCAVQCAYGYNLTQSYCRYVCYYDGVNPLQAVLIKTVTSPSFGLTVIALVLLIVGIAIALKRR